MKKFVITIGREYGSGGRIIGEKLAKRLGVNFYDKNMIDKIAEESGFTKEAVEALDGKKKRKNFSKNCKKAIWWQEPNIFMAI